MSFSERIGLIGLIACFTIAISAREESPLPASAKNQRLENCLRMADYVGRSKVASCKTTAEIATAASIPFANSFITCIDHLDRLITTNRDACHKKFQR